MRRFDIEANCARYLDREADPIVTDVIPFWFGIAHNSIQRVKNWKAQEATGVEQLCMGQDKYCAPTDIKEGFTLYSYDVPTNKAINVYRQVDMQTLRAFRRGDFLPIQFVNPLPPQLDHQVAHLFAIWAEDMEIYPTPGPELAGKDLRWDYYRWLPVPGILDSDWFTLHGGDYILYRMLQEAVPFLDSTDRRMEVWAGLMDRSRNEVFAIDVSATWASDSLQMRG
jgi:hypothetical protein